MNLQPMTELDRPDKLVTVLYGAPGQAKTVTAVRLAIGKTLLISADGSWDSLLQERWKEIIGNVQLFKLTSYKELNDIDYSSFETVIVDPFSEVVNNFMDTLLEHTDLPKRPKIVTKDRSLGELKGPGMDDYQITRNLFRKIMSVFVSDRVPANTLIFTSHANNPIKGMTQDDRIRPQIPNETFQIVARRAQIVTYIEGAGNRFHAHTNPMSTHAIGKSRFEEIKARMNLEDYIKVHRSIPRGGEK